MNGDWLERLPKVELHLHLEGAIPHEALWTLVGKYGGDAEVPTLEVLRRRFAYRDFPHFIETWNWKNQFLREYEDFSFIAAAVAHDLAKQNIRYVEAFYSPPDFARHGLAPQRLTAAIRAGLEQVPEIEVALIADVVRDWGPEEAVRTLAAVNEVQEQGVVGIGLGGSEQNYPPEPFAPIYREARSLGLHTSAHAGEAAGAASIWGALRALAVERIGHGTRAFEDPALLAHLVEHQIPLEMCPLSNVRTGVVASAAAHPVRQYFDLGIPVTVNTDDPRMFGNSLADEYRLLIDTFNFTPDEIRRLILTAIEVSWLPPTRKTELAASFRADPAWNDEG